MNLNANTTPTLLPPFTMHHRGNLPVPIRLSRRSRSNRENRPPRPEDRASAQLSARRIHPLLARNPRPKPIGTERLQLRQRTDAGPQYGADGGGSQTASAACQKGHASKPYDRPLGAHLRRCLLDPLTHPTIELADDDEGAALRARTAHHSYLCGHSHCYACIRRRLAEDFNCPVCFEVMYQAPFRQYAEEQSLAAEYPWWVAPGPGEYNWVDVVFPEPSKVVAVDSHSQSATVIVLKEEIAGCHSLLPHPAPHAAAHKSSRPKMPRFAAVVDVDFGEDPRETTTVIADHGVYFSADGRRRQEEYLNVTHKKRRVQPSELADLYGHWIPVPEDGYDGLEGVGSNSLSPLDAVTSVATKKRKLYASSDDPMSLWRPLKAKFADERLRHAGLGDDFYDPKCAHCKTPYVKHTGRIFKCHDCGQFLQCTTCCLSHHALTPLHVIKEWNGEFWIEASLTALGLVYQLGHGGFPCVVPDDKIYKMVVIEAPIIHQLHIKYCKCSKSDDTDNVEQLLRNACNFVHAIERATNATASTGMTWLPDRYKQFQRMARQWGFIERVRRAGLPLKPGGLEDVEAGSCAVTCWGCPYEGRNIPDNWRDVDPQSRFLYMLMVAVDTNFRLKNRMRANQVDDPSLGPGWGYWVEPQRYTHHLKKYIGEKNLSTCIAFAALLQKDTRITTGPRSSGVGGCVCARHECVRPTGMGDLQKGERYFNMDYIVASALFGFSLMLLTISYNIACQWKKNLPERNDNLPKKLRLPLKDITLQCALPVWHAGSHNEECEKDNSLSYKVGVGKSDGEGVERVWSVLNPSANHMKDAGRGQRADSLEDKIDNHNFLKILDKRKLIVAIAERDRQVAAFKEVSATIEAPVKKLWKKQINDWLEKPDSHPNPYTLPRKDCSTEAEVHLEVKKDEDTALAGGSSPLQGRSATALLIAGMQIEEAQCVTYLLAAGFRANKIDRRRIIADTAGTALMTADAESKLQDWRHALLVKIDKFRELQRVYMPGAAAVIAASEARCDSDTPAPKAEKIKLFMPSEMPSHAADPLRGCMKGLLDMESKLRVAQCGNALVKLRARLHAKRHFIMFRNEHVTGQIQATKARTLIGQIGERVDACAAKYRHARAALIKLSGVAPAQFLELRPQDIQLDSDAGESDAAARKKLAMISFEAHNVLDMDCAVRVEWARARARKTRWEEEVMLLREEMQRVLRYLGWQATWWREHVSARTDNLSPDIAAGIHAYALQQGDLHERLAAFFKAKWNMPALTAAQRLVALEEAAEDEEADLAAFFQ
ncbi:hypothetical protein C8F04DRAFT_1193688 [Mycena alexandri]|uniref:CxC2-like cysteine cluster KDZ transposase-associated domain-containing protein n=1 Tax=Mycena alexandri TaxID=1745969 RepID=A0AAD6SCW9_9AGAR|nr:hypothetical protein C8F04DRAFT_1193688 [Mycena alexandri]